MKDLNDIKKQTKNAGTTSVVISVLFDLNSSTVTNWNSNAVQPTLQIIDDLADFLEISNSELIISTPRKKTGLAKATQEEFKRLLKSGMSHKITSKDLKGHVIEINNPELVKALREFVGKYKIENRSVKQK